MPRKRRSATPARPCSNHRRCVDVPAKWTVSNEAANVDRHRYYKITRSRSAIARSEEHTSELQSLMRISYAVFCLKNKTTNQLPQVRELTPQTNTTTHRN